MHKLGCIVQLWLEGSETKEIFVKFRSEILRLFCCFRIEANLEKFERETKTKKDDTGTKLEAGSEPKGKGKLWNF
jgi:hypothetical protein